MSFSLKISVPYEDTGYNLKIKSKTILQYFQKIAIEHSASLGYNTDRYEKEKVGWVLSKLYFEVNQLPEYGDNIDINTWSMGINGFKGTRRFEIFKKNKLLITGVSLWLYIDTERKRLKKVPKHVIKDYTETDENLLSNKLEFPTVKNEGEFDNYLMNLRISDFDNNMHLNNIAYIDILDTLLFQNISGYCGFNKMNINYMKEIVLGESDVEVGLNISNKNVGFKFIKNNLCSANGNCEINLKRS